MRKYFFKKEGKREGSKGGREREREEERQRDRTRGREWHAEGRQMQKPPPGSRARGGEEVRGPRPSHLPLRGGGWWTRVDSTRLPRTQDHTLVGKREVHFTTLTQEIFHGLKVWKILNPEMLPPTISPGYAMRRPPAHFLFIAPGRAALSVGFLSLFTSKVLNCSHQCPNRLWLQ